MKRTGLILLIMGALVISSCKHPYEVEDVTDEDAAEFIQEAVKMRSGGLSEDITRSSEILLAPTTGNYGPFTCGVQLDTIITQSYSNGITASFTHNLYCLLNCNGNIPQSLSLSGDHTGSYDGPRITSSTNGTRSWVITGLAPSSGELIYNGTTYRNGTHTSKIHLQQTFTTSINTSASDLKLNKSNRTIISGMAAVHLTCTASNGNSYDFTGTMIFNGDDTATLSLNGKTFIIVLT